MGAVPGGFGVIGRFFGNTVSAATGYAFGVATGPVLAPAVEELRQKAWTAYHNRIPDVGTLAAGVAEGHVQEADVLAWAVAHGFGKDVFESLCRLRGTGPGVALAFQLRRRGFITPEQLAAALKREAIEDEWIVQLVKLTRVLLSPAELANAVVQGHRDYAAALPDAIDQGLEAADFQTMVDNTGLPPGPETLLDWRRRGILTDDEAVAQGIREGHTKVKYIDEYLAAVRRVLSATEYASLWLRGWITEAQAKAGGQLTGFDGAAMDLMYQNRGRPATTRQTHIGYVRGGRLPGAATERATFERAVEESNIRTEWTELLWSQRYTYPSAFVVRGLTTSGSLTADEADEILRFSGWEPTLARKVADLWGGGTTAGASKWVGQARTRLVTVTHNEYLDWSLDGAEAKAELTRAGVPAADQDTVVSLWSAERAITRLELTPAQIRKAYTKGLYEQATAIAELEERGMTAADALTFLTE